jgi:glucose-1-phosphate thymidylyltransferase
MLLGWTSGVMFVYAALFGTGSFIYGRTGQALVWLLILVVAGTVLVRTVLRLFSGEHDAAGGESSAVADARPVRKAVILARGLGTRMRDPTQGSALAPAQSAAADRGLKGMIPVGRPFLDYVLHTLADAGFTDVCLVIGPEHDAVRHHYTAHTVPTRLRVHFAVQPQPLGTADAVLAAEEFVAGEMFVVLNADNHYPEETLRALRALHEPAVLAFSRAGLLRDGSIPAGRIASFALLDIGTDGYVRRIVEKPRASDARMLQMDAPVSMNCWLLSSPFFRACRAVPASPRGELELPLAVQYAIDVLGLRVRAVPVDAAVLDLSSRGDIAMVAERLRDLDVRL